MLDCERILGAPKIEENTAFFHHHRALVSGQKLSDRLDDLLRGLRCVFAGYYSGRRHCGCQSLAKDWRSIMGEKTACIRVLRTIGRVYRFELTKRTRRF